MSDEAEGRMDPDHPMMALFLGNYEGDELTDMLVAALTNAFRLLEEDRSFESVH